MTRFGAGALTLAIWAAAVSASCSPQFNLATDAANGDLAAVQRDLANKVDPNSKAAGEHALSYAAGNGHLDVVQVLLRAGADVNAKDDNDGYTALMSAAANGHNYIIKILVAAGADLETRDKTDETALILAATLNSPDTVQALIDEGADVNEGYSTGGPSILSVFQDQPKYAAPRSLRNWSGPALTEQLGVNRAQRPFGCLAAVIQRAA